MNKRYLFTFIFVGLLLIGSLLWRQFIPSESPLKPVATDTSAIPSGVATIAYRFENAPVGLYTLAIDLPQGWQTVSFPSTYDLTESEATLFVNVQIPAQTEADSYPITLNAKRDNTALQTNSTVTVKSIAVPRMLSDVEQLDVEEGDPLLLDYTLTNIGNKAGRFELEMKEFPEDWLINMLENSPELQPGESTTVTVQAIVAKGASLERKELTFSAKSLDQESVVLLKVYVLPESQD